ncbi:MAG: GntR family transcriptional regulator [Burkholderiaceae bacterium]|nr:GntR family transcriptional regulator [Burkholderiaceae bacterium]
MIARGPGAKSRDGRSDASASLVDAAYAQLRSRILDNVWPPGYRALEQELAQMLGMSRTPVREALIRLQNEGLVEVVPRHGMRVLPVSPADMADIYQILTSLEATATELVAARKPSNAEIEPLERATRDMEDALARDDLDAWARADERFHRHLIDSCGNRLLANVVENFWDRAHRARMFTLRLRPKPERSTREHVAVVAAIRKGDAHAARELHRAHRERGGSELTALLERYKVTQV